MSRRPPSRAWRLLRPLHTRRGRIERAEPVEPAVDRQVECRIEGCSVHQGRFEHPRRQPYDWEADGWPGPDLSPSTTELLVEDEIRAEIEAKRRAREAGDG